MPAITQQSQKEADRLSAINTINSEIDTLNHLKDSLNSESLSYLFFNP